MLPPRHNRSYANDAAKPFAWAFPPDGTARSSRDEMDLIDVAITHLSKCRVPINRAAQRSSLVVKHNDGAAFSYAAAHFLYLVVA